MVNTTVAAFTALTSFSVFTFASYRRASASPASTSGKASREMVRAPAARVGQPLRDRAMASSRSLKSS